MESWRLLALGSPLFAAPSAITPAPVMGKLEVLPFEMLSWQDFERLQCRVLRDVEGLRSARLYGDPGQAQFGLDIVALAPNGTGVALQSKKYKRFGAAELNAAVHKFQVTARPFEVNRLIIGVARTVRSTGAGEALASRSRELAPTLLELWDAQELSRLLRNRPEIVVEFFGLPTAEAFCLPFSIDSTTIPTADAAAVRDAIARTPEVTTGAGVLFAEAQNSADPAEALALIEEGQGLLRDAGFGPHAAAKDKTRVGLLAAIGRADEARRLTLEGFWTALDQGFTSAAQATGAQLTGPEGAMLGGETLESVRRVVDLALGLYLNPMAHVPDISAIRAGDPSDRARLMLLAGETALASDNFTWLVGAVPTLAELATVPGVDQMLRTRLRLLVAEAVGDWSEILGEAQKLNLGYALHGLVAARYARYCALRQRFAEADAYWDEAAGVASLAKRWSDAATWIMSRRAFRVHWAPFKIDDLLPMQVAVRAMGESAPIVPTAMYAYEEALASLNSGKLRAGAISGQRALRDAVVTGDWAGETNARRALASILIASEEPVAATRHLARAGASQSIDELGKALTLTFVDVLDDLDAPNYWTVGGAFRMLAAQADLVPESHMRELSAHILEELERAESGGEPDMTAFGTSRYNNALKALAGVADRLDRAEGVAVLRHFESQPPVREGHYRYHDADEAVTVAKIALAQAPLAARAIAHLVPLLGRSQVAHKEPTAKAVDRNWNHAQDSIDALANTGNRWAVETMAWRGPGEVEPEVAAQAIDRLSTPLKHTKGVQTVGTNAVGDSLLVRHLAPDAVSKAVAELLGRAGDPLVSSSDRGEYLTAAANLVSSVTASERSAFFATAVDLAANYTPSEFDALDAQFAHSLGAFRIVGGIRDSRGEAVFLASLLATDEQERAEVRRLAYELLGDPEGYWPARALQHLGDAVKDDLAFLASQGWALRSLAAILWAEHDGPLHVGSLLARDSDVRVRRALAGSLATDSSDRNSPIRDLLAADPAYSVRSALIGQ